MTVYQKIEKVLRVAGRPLAAHEFAELSFHEGCNGRKWIGCSESTLGRRLREMRTLGRVTAQRRDGKAFVEYALVEKKEAVPA